MLHLLGQTISLKVSNKNKKNSTCVMWPQMILLSLRNEEQPNRNRYFKVTVKYTNTQAHYTLLSLSFFILCWRHNESLPCWWTVACVWGIYVRVSVCVCVCVKLKLKLMKLKFLTPICATIASTNLKFFRWRPQSPLIFCPTLFERVKHHHFEE